jgi:hypothetical protein
MSSKADIVLGAHQVHALGDVDIQSLGAGVTIRAAGDKGDLMLDADGAAHVSCGPAVLTLTQSSPAEGKVDLVAGPQGTIALWVGLPKLGAQIKIEPTKITLSVGPPNVGSLIEMTPTGITLQVAKTSFKMTPTGITEELAETKREFTPLGHTLKAAETKVDVQVMGTNVKAPMHQSKVEAVNQQKETLSTHGTDAMRQQQVGIEMES